LIRRTSYQLDRRSFVALIAGGLLAAPLAAEAQKTGKVYRVGFLEVVAATSNTTNLAAFRQGLRELGYVEGQNFVIEYRSADGRAERFPDLADELVRLKVDVIVTRGTQAALAAKHATGTIPVVMASSGGPLATGLAASLAHPGGNVTGLSAFATEIQGKQLELVKEIVPRIARIGFLFNMSNPVRQAEWKAAESLARSAGLQAQLIDARTARDLEAALEAATRHRIGALVVGVDAQIQANRAEIAQSLIRRHLPSMSREREFVEAGGLMSYGVHYPDLYRRAAAYVDKIFKGAKPADLPVEQPTKFELVINLKTAKDLGLTIPQSLLLRADEVLG
jgi:putative tryptophan/tyrosine transport system substrate-binding protein